MSFPAKRPTRFPEELLQELKQKNRSKQCTERTIEGTMLCYSAPSFSFEGCISSAAERAAGWWIQFQQLPVIALDWRESPFSTSCPLSRVCNMHLWRLPASVTGWCTFIDTWPLPQFQNSPRSLLWLIITQFLLCPILSLPFPHRF